MADVPPDAPEDAREDARQARRVARMVAAGSLVLRALARTWRIRTVGAEPLARLRAARTPVIFALWHGELLPLLWQHRDEGVHVLISEHRDGEIVARMAERLGFRTVRGSTSRGAARALLRVVRVLQDGGDIAITPDGPRGPARRWAPGALIAAQRTGTPLVAVSVSADRAWHLRSWDRFMIPKPFARLTVAYAEPTRVSALTVRDAALETARFEALHRHADSLAAGTPGGAGDDARD
jgi:lysophospholipid acyltransferase (LPLAT)-like uncharacterized protein